MPIFCLRALASVCSRTAFGRRTTAWTSSTRTAAPSRIRSVAMLIAITAIVPSVFMVIPMVTAIIVAFAWPNDAADDKAEQSQYKGTVRNTLCFCHGRVLFGGIGQSRSSHDGDSRRVRRCGTPLIQPIYPSAHRLPSQPAARCAHLAMHSACHFRGNRTSGSPIRSTH